MKKLVSVQEVFDKVAAHLLTQKQKSTFPKSGTCAYRGRDGLKCAIGVLINDAVYDASIERFDVMRPEIIKALALSGVNVDVQMLADLQLTHDTYDVCDWRGALRGIAVKHGLSQRVLDDI